MQRNILVLLLWSSVAAACSDRFAIVEIGSPAKRQAEIMQAFCTFPYPKEWARPQEIVDRGCKPDAYFKECVLRVDGDKMASAWLRDFFSDRDVVRYVSQESLDEMLTYAVEMPGVSSGLIEQLLSYGADPSAGIKPPIAYLFKQLTVHAFDTQTVSKKLCLMLQAIRKDPRMIQYANESLADAEERFMACVAKRADCKADLRVKLGKFGEKQSNEAYAAYCHEWKQICELLSERRLRGSGDVSNSPFRRKKTAFEKFAMRCVDACAAQK